MSQHSRPSQPSPASHPDRSRADQRTGTAEALLDAAEALFSEKGYAAVSTRELVERAGANIAAINYHFGSKSELYLATVRRAMARAERDSAWSVFRQVPADRKTAAALLVLFIRTYLHHLIDGSGSRQTCGMLMLWEAIQPSEAIDAVVRDYIKPGRDGLIALVDRLIPDRERAHAGLYARSILAQILHYRIFRPFIERTDGEALSPATVDAAATHVARFSLRGMGFDDAWIDGVIKAAAAGVLNVAEEES